MAGSGATAGLGVFDLPSPPLPVLPSLLFHLQCWLDAQAFPPKKWPGQLPAAMDLNWTNWAISKEHSFPGASRTTQKAGMTGKPWKPWESLEDCYHNLFVSNGCTQSSILILVQVFSHKEKEISWQVFKQGQGLWPKVWRGLHFGSQSNNQTPA